MRQKGVGVGGSYAPGKARNQRGREPDSQMGDREIGLMGMGFSAVAVAAGAIMYWAVTYQGHGFRFSTVGVILMVVRAVGFVVSTIVFAVSRRPVGGRRHAYDRETVDAQCRSTEVHEKTK